MEQNKIKIQFSHPNKRGKEQGIEYLCLSKRAGGKQICTFFVFTSKEIVFLFNFPLIALHKTLKGKLMHNNNQCLKINVVQASITNRRKDMQYDSISSIRKSNGYVIKKLMCSLLKIQSAEEIINAHQILQLSTWQQLDGYCNIQENLQIECSFLRFWIMIPIVCSNWSDTLDSFEILNIRANSPMICFSIKYLKEKS